MHAARRRREQSVGWVLAVTSCELTPGDTWTSRCGLMELRFGDCLEVLRDVKAEACITDPPYSVRQHNGFRSASDFKKEAKRRHERMAAKGRHPGGVFSVGVPYAPIDASWAERAFDLIDAMDCRWLLAFGDHISQRWWDDAVDLRTWLTFAPLGWVKSDGGAPRFQGDGPQSGIEWITAARRRGAYYCGSLPAYYIHPQMSGSAKGKILKGQKPIGLMRRIIRDYTEPGQTVVDLCAGSGTTLIAAAMEGRRAVGAEIDPATFRKAVARLSKPYTQATLFEVGSTTGKQEAFDL